VPATRAGQPLAPLSPSELAERRLDDFGGFDKTPRGGELRLDDTIYAGLGSVRVAVQDESGLVGVGFPVNSPVVPMLQAADVKRERHAALLAALQDFIDPDGLRRLAGAEATDYERAGLAPPLGRPLAAPGELWRVLGWSELPEAARARIGDWSTVGYSGALNLNTAPEPVIGAIAMGCGRACRARLAQRPERPFEDARQFEMETGARLPGDRDVDFRTAPSELLRFTLWGASGSAWRIHVRLTPLADQAAPWSVDAAYRVPRPVSDDVPRTIQSPLFAAPPLAGR
jgi:general secretion pathway protein K